MEGRYLTVQNGKRGFEIDELYAWTGEGFVLFNCFAQKFVVYCVTRVFCNIFFQNAQHLMPPMFVL